MLTGARAGAAPANTFTIGSVVHDQLSSDLASLRIDRTAPRPPSALRRLIVPVVAIGAIGVAALYGYQRLQGEIFKQEVKTTEIAMISPSQADVTVTATGYVIPQITSKVGSKLPGRIAKVNVKEGDTVKEGQVIAQLEDADQKSQVVAASTRVGAAQARIATARANLAEISQQVERERALVASGAVGKANLDNLVARESALKETVRAAEAETTVAQADVGTVGVGLKDRIIIAPISGRIVTKPATIGEFVGGIGNVGLVAEIVDFESLMVEADVPEPRLHLVKVGGPCEIILDAYPNKRFRCEASQLGQRVNRSKATIMVKVKFQPSSPEEMEGVLPEMSARVSFLSKAISDATKDEKPKKVVATDAIVERNGGKVVFAINEGKLHTIPVKIGGPVGASAVELLDGPPQGTKVVSKPTSDMTDGQRIKETDK
jgi:RND family efflux transporter MFP subunit